MPALKPPRNRDDFFSLVDRVFTPFVDFIERNPTASLIGASFVSGALAPSAKDVARAKLGAEKELLAYQKELQNQGRRRMEDNLLVGDIDLQGDRQKSAARAFLEERGSGAGLLGSYY